MPLFFENIKKINEIFLQKIEFIKNETDLEEIKKIFFGKNG